MAILKFGFRMVCFRMVDHSKTKFQNVRNWDGVQFSKFGFRAPTVFKAVQRAV